MSIGGVTPSPVNPGTASGGFPAATSAGAPPRDAALAKAFPQGLSSEVRSGARGTQVVAIQYALGRLGHLDGLADGSFGPKTRAAIESFQSARGLPLTGTIDARTLSALDTALASFDPRTPASRAPDPLAYLSDFAARGVSRIEIRDRSRPINWQHPEVQAAYGKFVGEYWGTLKENRVECDCKTLALYFMDQFRAKVKADTGADLPLPSSSEGRVPRSTWLASTAARPNGFFQRTDALPATRPGYAAAGAIEKLDPKQSMLYGVNLRYAGIDANATARAARTLVAWSPSRENRGDLRRPEVPAQDLNPGDIVFIDHTGDGKYDHTVNVVGVERDAAGKAKRLTLAVGSYDDMKDADAATTPRGLNEVNQYCEEVTVDLAPDGKVASSRVTWRSEPSYVHDSRYSASTTLMELKPGGVLKVARWG